MAAATAANPTEPPPLPGGGLSLHLLKSIDMTTLSQSELRALSTLSFPENGAAAAAPAEATATAIDHSTFNESSGSRRQTYSRLSPHHPHHHHRHHRLAAPLSNPPALSPNPNSSPLPPELDPDRLDCRSILASLKQLLSSHPDFQFPDPVDFEGFPSFYGYEPVAGPETGFGSGERIRRKRGRKPRMAGAEWERNAGALVNRDGAVVDLVALAGREDPFAEELARRTAGMDGEEELLGFFARLGGEWCSRRKRRKVVDASEFGNALPRGWKLLLALRRKEGRAWVYCRRYVSPDGQHFISCKEVSEYLRAFTRSYDVRQGKDYLRNSFWQTTAVASGNHAATMEKDGYQKLSKQHDNDITILDLDNLVEVEVHDLFECFKCSISFDEKDSYLQHLLSVHQQGTRRPRGGTVGEGVIIKDGKYECQFCHKVFHERRRYSSHVGIHVRNYVRGIEDSPGVRMALERSNESPVTDDSPARISKMDALIEIAQNSIHDGASSGPNQVGVVDSTSDKQNMSSIPQHPRAVPDNKPNVISPPSEVGLENGESDSSAHTETDQESDDHMEIDGEMQKLEDSCNVVDVMVENDHAFGTTEIGQSAKQLETDEDHAVSLLTNHKTSLFEDSTRSSRKNGVVQVGSDICTGIRDNRTEHNSSHQHCEEKGLENLNLESPATSLQSPHKSSYNADIEKGGNFLGTNDNGSPPKISAFQELRMEEIDQLKFSSVTGQQSMSLQDAPSAFGSGGEVDESYDTTIQLVSEDVMETSDGQQHTTLCVWCGVEFVHETVDAELQSDSVGYMCLTCKAKVSGQIGVLDGGCS